MTYFQQGLITAPSAHYLGSQVQPSLLRRSWMEKNAEETMGSLAHVDSGVIQK